MGSAYLRTKGEGGEKGTAALREQLSKLSQGAGAGEGGKKRGRGERAEKDTGA